MSRAVASLSRRSNTATLTSSVLPVLVSRLAQTSVVLALQSVLPNDIGVTAAQSSGATTAVLAGIYSPNGPAQLGRLNALATAMFCAYSIDEQQPSFLEVPLQVAVGSSAVRWYAGSALLTAAVLLLPCVIAHAALWHAAARGFVKATAVRAIGKVHCVFVAALAPGVVQTGVTAAAHGESMTDFVCGIASVAIAVGSLARVARHVLLGVSVFLTRVPSGDLHVGAWYREALGEWFVDSKDPMRLLHRAHGVEEVGSAVALALVAGTRPAAQSACDGVAAFCVAIAATHFCYVVIVRPLVATVDLVFSTGIAAVTTVMAATACFVRVDRERAPIVFGWCTFLLLLLFPLQLVVKSATELLAWHRKRLQFVIDSQLCALQCELKAPMVNRNPLEVVTGIRRADPSRPSQW